MYTFVSPPKDKKVFVSSDFHGYHKNICTGSTSWDDKSGCRDFDNEFVMTDKLVENVNSVVKADDFMYFLGDWTFGGYDKVKLLRDRIDCKNIVYIFGNHCHHIRENEELQKLFLRVMDYNEFWYRGTLVCMSHFPIASWHKMGKKGINLYGHSHNSLSLNLGRHLDVGVDCNNLFPFTLDEAVSLALAKDRVSVDHHKGQE